nr:hypothetical protein [Tanacetum cinerariifolium]
MATTLEQQLVLDEALVLMTADVPKIYMQEFWATAKLHQHSIRFKMDTKKHVLDLEAFREMLHISPRIPSQSFSELPFEEEIMEFLRSNVDYAYLIWEDFVYQVEHKNQKKSNEMYYPRFTKVIIDYFMTRKPSIPRRNRVNWHYDRDEVLFSTIKVHQNQKANARKKKGGSASSTTPPTPISTPTPTTTVVAAPRLYDDAKGKQPTRATTPTEPTDIERTEAEQLKIILRRSRQEMHISQQYGSGTDEGTGSRPGVPDVPFDDSEEELSWNSSDDEDVDTQTQGSDESEGKKTDDSDDDDDAQEEAEKVNDDDDNEEEVPKIGEYETTESDEGDNKATESDRESEDEETREQEEESFDPIPQTPKESEDDDKNEEDQGLRIGMESIFMSGSTIVTPIPSPQSTMTPSIISTFTTASQLPTPPTQILMQTQTDRLQDSIQRENDEFLKTIDENMKKIIKEQVKTQVKAQVTRILPRIEESVNAQLEAEVLTRSSRSSRTSYVVAADLSEMELKKFLIDKMEGNKSIQRSDEQRNLYKELEGAFAGSERGSKRQREGGEHASASTPSEPATGSAGRSTIGSQTRQLSTSEFAFAEEPISALAKQTDARSLFNELLDTPIDFSNFIMNRLGVDTLTPELLAGPTYELMRRSYNSLMELEYHLEEVYKVTTDQLDWVNPKGQQYPHNLLQPLPLIPDNRTISI